MGEQMKGKTVLITGGASGIGLACGRRFIAEGASVVVADYAEDRGAAAVSELEALGGKAVFVQTDVTSAEACTHMVAFAAETFGSVDAVIAAAGIASAGYVTGEISERAEDPMASFVMNKALADWQRVIDVNLTGVMLTNQAAIAWMMAHDTKGAIVNIASIAGQRPLPGAADYCVSKAGVIMLTKVVAAEMSELGIRINAIGPGFIETPMTAGIRAENEGNTMVMSMTPMGRYGQPEEIASTALFLASDESSYFTGQTLFPNGGMFVG